MPLKCFAVHLLAGGEWKSPNDDVNYINVYIISAQTTEQWVNLIQKVKLFPLDRSHQKML